MNRSFSPFLFSAFAVLSVALLALPGFAQPTPPLPRPLHGTAPLLYVRFIAGGDMEFSFYRSGPRGKSYPYPVTIGLRPGYFYRVQVDNLPGHPGMSLFPSIEVRGTLCLPPKVSAKEHPVPVLITEQDVDQVLAGGLVTKVIYLENPARAPALAAQTATRNGVTFELPAETDLQPEHDLLRQATEVGRPLLVVRIGQRLFSHEEMGRQAVPGTVLFPGEAGLMLPAKPPVVPPVTWQWYDPTLGPRCPEGEYLYNGNINPDRNESAATGNLPGTGFIPGMLPGIDHEGRLRGLRSEDAVAEFTDKEGQRSVVRSNRVCLIAPRFAALRQNEPLGAYSTNVAAADARRVCAQNSVASHLPVGQASQQEILRGFHARQRPTGSVAQQGLLHAVQYQVLDAHQVVTGPAELLGTEQMARLTEVQMLHLKRQVELARAFSEVVRVSSVGNIEGTVAIGRVETGPETVVATVETRDVTHVCGKEPCQSPDKPLVLIKWADRESAHVGDVITFFLKYSNQGLQPLTDVAISDSLSSRLEYIPGSAESRRPAVFSTQENEAGSLILRWEFAGRLLPGESSVVRFQARVR